VVRFDGWVDHAGSRMDITENGKVVERLVPTRDSEPDVLAASAPALAPGRCQLHWHAKSIPDGDFSDGFIPFTVARWCWSKRWPSPSARAARTLAGTYLPALTPQQQMATTEVVTLPVHVEGRWRI
jgi:hypothetical protein